MATNTKKSINEVDTLIENNEIVAIKIGDLKTLGIIEKKDNKEIVQLVSPDKPTYDDLSDNYTLLYRIENGIYAEYYTHKIIISKNLLSAILSEEITTDVDALENAISLLKIASFVIDDNFKPLDIEIKNKLQNDKNPNNIYIRFIDLMAEANKDKLKSAITEARNRLSVAKVYTKLQGHSNISIFSFAELKRYKTTHGNKKTGFNHTITLTNLPEAIYKKLEKCYGILLPTNKNGIYLEYYSGLEVRLISGEEADEINTKNNDFSNIREFLEEHEKVEKHPLIVTEDDTKPLNTDGSLNKLKANYDVKISEIMSENIHIIKNELSTTSEEFIQQDEMDANLENGLYDLINLNLEMK